MNAQTWSGAAVVAAFLPMLLLALRLRRSRHSRAALLALGGLSLLLLGTGVALMAMPAVAG